MTNVMGSRFSEAVMTTGSLGMLVVAMAAIDERVRMFLTGVLTSNPSGELAQVSVGAQRFARIVMETTNGYGSDAVLLVLLAVATLILATFMLRT